MLDPKISAELDQSIAIMVEMYPRLWKQLYDGCVSEGFTKEQAFEIVLEAVSTQLHRTS